METGLLSEALGDTTFAIGMDRQLDTNLVALWGVILDHFLVDPLLDGLEFFCQQIGLELL